MRIVYQHRTLADGAEGIHIREIVRALEQLGHDVTLIGPAAARRPAGLGQTSRSPWSWRGSMRLPQSLRRLLEIAYNLVTYGRSRRALRRERPDFVYERYSCFSVGGVLAAAHARTPLILEVNATHTGKWGSRHVLCFPGLARRMERYVLNQASGIVVVSQALRDDLIESGIPAEKIRVSPNAIDPEVIAALDVQAARAEVRRRLQLDDRTVVGFVGSLRRWHGVDLLAEAARQLAHEDPNIAFLIVGSGELADELREQVRISGLRDRVILTGGVAHAEVFPLIAAMDITVMPDSNEFGSPMKILEYMALGKTTVAPRLGPIEELIEDGQTGRLFTRRSVTELLACLRELAADPRQRERLGQNARRHVLAERTWRKNAEQIVDLYQAVSARGVPHALPGTRGTGGPRGAATRPTEPITTMENSRP
ncbi:MAG: glycosyltransferase family 4 protein [Pirellulaceae bacterium]|nr:glycosyltransferase family 4 protein [Pirellulaceae bacterium]